MSQAATKHGDFSGLADNYARYRPGYSESVLTAVLALVGRPVEQIDAADVGAGTGIWSAMMAARGCRSVIAVEPNDDMRETGAQVTRSGSIHWRLGSGEETGLPSGSVDLLTAASSLHWMDFDRASREFARALRPGGRFVALWNPREIEASPLLAEIEARVHQFCPTLKRVSSGRSGLAERLTGLLSAHPDFDDVLYIEGRHAVFQTIDQYLGAWRSVNDIQVQLGPDTFTEFLAYVARRLEGLPGVETTYLTRAWAARRR